jgi:hypothetical protein
VSASPVHIPERRTLQGRPCFRYHSEYGTFMQRPSRQSVFFFLRMYKSVEIRPSYCNNRIFNLCKLLGVGAASPGVRSGASALSDAVGVAVVAGGTQRGGASQRPIRAPARQTPARVPPAADIAPNAAPLRIVQPAGFLRISTFTRRLHLQRIDSSHRGVLPRAWWLKSQACHPEAARRPRVVPWFGNHHAGRHAGPRRPNRFRSGGRIITGCHPNRWYTWDRANRRVSVPQ